MKFGLMGVGSGSTVRPDMLTQIAQKGEELGFESAWIPEHLAVPVEMKANYPGSADGKFPGGPGVALHDPFVALSFVAAQDKDDQARHWRFCLAVAQYPECRQSGRQSRCVVRGPHDARHWRGLV